MLDRNSLLRKLGPGVQTRLGASKELVETEARGTYTFIEKQGVYASFVICLLLQWAAQKATSPWTLLTAVLAVLFAALPSPLPNYN